MITPELQAEILSLRFGKKLGTRRISRLLRVNRKTVRSVIASRTVSLKPERKLRVSMLDAYDAQIIELLTRAPEIPAHTIYLRLKSQGCTSSRFPTFSILENLLN